MISVIMPVYRHEAYVWEAVQSIIDQTEKDWELLILSDDPECICLRDIESLDHRIRYFKADAHMGQTHRLNMGIDLALGEYIAFQDADDVSLRWRLERSLDLIGPDEPMDHRIRVDLVYANKILRYPDRDVYFETPIWDPNRFHEQCTGAWGSYMVRKSAAKAVRFDQTGYWNDHIWEAKLASIGVTVKKDSVPYYIQRTYSSNFCTWKIPVVRKIQRKSAQRKINDRVYKIVRGMEG